ncbi:MAG: NUDIX domain-containing protein, partial [Thermoplasmata archaeon]
DAAKREIIEETGIKNPLLKKKGGYMYLRDGSRLWKIYTFLWEVNSEEINIDWEHTEYKWIYPEKIKNFDTVPGLNGAIKKLLN